jgi:CHAT domain-containing protein
VVDEEDPDRSRLVFSSPGKAQPVDYLFAKEIYDLDLSGVRLTTLAACDTETGRSIPGEGVAALSRAFLSAGAQSTVSTLWRIGDRSSAEFMRRFYGELASGQNAAEALRSAKLESARSMPPRDWAAFVLNGDAGVRIPRRMPLTAGPLFLAVLAALLWMFWRPQKVAGAKGVAAPLTGSATKPRN